MMSLISLGLQKIKIKDEEAKCHTSILQGIDIHPGRKISNNFNFFLVTLGVFMILMMKQSLDILYVMIHTSNSSWKKNILE